MKPKLSELPRLEINTLDELHWPLVELDLQERVTKNGQFVLYVNVQGETICRIVLTRHNLKLSGLLAEAQGLLP